MPGSGEWPLLSSKVLGDDDGRGILSMSVNKFQEDPEIIYDDE